MELPLEDWLKYVLDVANATGDHPFTTLLRQKLRQLIDGKLLGPLSRRIAHPLPPLFADVRSGRLRVFTDLEFSKQAAGERLEDLDKVAWLNEHFAEELDGALYALAVDELGKRIRQCDQCGSFFVFKRNHRRPHYFCCEEHRRRFDHAHRDREQQAAYMRKRRHDEKIARKHPRRA
jgi:hypothetical protein